MPEIKFDEAPLMQTLLGACWRWLRGYPILVFCIIVAVRFLLRRYYSPLYRYPGPFLASGSRLYALFTTWQGKTHEKHVELHRKYGEVIRIQPNQLSFSSPEAARQVLAPGKGFHKTHFYWVFPPKDNPDIFTEIREDVHAMKKRFVNQPYGLASFQALTPWIDDTIQLLCHKLDDLCTGTPGAIDLGSYLHYFAFDVLGQVAFSTPFGFLEQGHDVGGAISLIDSVQTYDGIIGQVPFLDYFLRRNPLWKYLPFTTQIGDNHITRTALDQLAARENGTADTDRRDLLSMLLEAHEKDPEKFSKDAVFAVAHGAIFAGSDSTASTMQTFMWNVLNNQAVYTKLVEEILTADEQGDLSDIITWQESQKSLPYFQACLKEAMRVGPAVGLPIYRKVPRTGAEIDGLFVPGGVEVAVNAWVLHRDPDIFGSDSERYRPDRWLFLPEDKEDEARVKRMERYMFQFGGGSHVCIGRNLALLEMSKVLPQLLRRYCAIELEHPGRELKKHSSFFVVQDGLRVKMKKRKES